MWDVNSKKVLHKKKKKIKYIIRTHMRYHSNFQVHVFTAPDGVLLVRPFESPVEPWTISNPTRAPSFDRVGFSGHSSDSLRVRFNCTFTSFRLEQSIGKKNVVFPSHALLSSTCSRPSSEYDVWRTPSARYGRDCGHVFPPPAHCFATTRVRHEVFFCVRPDAVRVQTVSRLMP